MDADSSAGNVPGRSINKRRLCGRLFFRAAV